MRRKALCENCKPNSIGLMTRGPGDYHCPVCATDFVVVDTRLESLLGAGVFPDPYAKLREVLERAFIQASGGKGKERHAEDGEAFEDQVICEVRRRVGHGYTRGQAVKKIYEAGRLPKDRAVAELLGAINYIAADIIVLEEEA